MTPKEDVANWANALDDHFDDWHLKLVAEYGHDLRDLVISDATRCVLSALFGNFGRGLRIVAYGNDVLMSDNSEGYSAVADNGPHNDDEARSLWLAEVYKRTFTLS